MSKLSAIFSRITLVLAVLALGVTGFFTIVPRFVEYRKLARKRDELQTQIDRKKLDIEVLKEKQQRFKTDPEFVELVAREKKMVRPNEVVFVFEDQDTSR